MKAISMFPAYSGELVSVNALHEDIAKEKSLQVQRKEPKRQGVFHFFQF
jgi:hypothetical protein